MNRPTILLLLLSVWLTAGCVEPLEHEAPRLYLRIELPEDPVTKGEVGSEAAWTAERTLKNLHVWVFRNDNGALIDYKKFSENDLALMKTGMSDRWYIELSGSKAAIATEKPNVDVYALANAGTAGTGLNFNNTTTRAQLKDALMGVGAFGTANPMIDNSISSNGVPYSGVGTDLPISGDYPMLELEPVTLVRTVSKITFLFCQVCVDDEDKTLVDDFQIGTVTFPGYQICNKEYVFNDTRITGTSLHVDADPTNNNDYQEAPISFENPVLARNPFPEKYTYRSASHSTESAAEYAARIRQAVEDGLLTRRVYYLRESNKQLAGSFSYKIADGDWTDRTFSMGAAGDFARNHDWVVYVYFLADEILFRVSWVQWEQGGVLYLTPEN